MHPAGGITITPEQADDLFLLASADRRACETGATCAIGTALGGKARLIPLTRKMVDALAEALDNAAELHFAPLEGSLRRRRTATSLVVQP
jgi:hypothetical protein